MKPKRRVYCVAAQKQKLQFDTEQKALNYIRYNSEEIKEEGGYAPKRAYYCPACCAWHVTSHNYDPKRDCGTKKISTTINSTCWKVIPREVLQETPAPHVLTPLLSHAMRLLIHAIDTFYVSGEEAALEELDKCSEVLNQAKLLWNNDGIKIIYPDQKISELLSQLGVQIKKTRNTITGGPNDLPVRILKIKELITENRQYFSYTAANSGGYNFIFTPSYMVSYMSEKYGVSSFKDLETIKFLELRIQELWLLKMNNPDIVKKNLVDIIKKVEGLEDGWKKREVIKKILELSQDL